MASERCPCGAYARRRNCPKCRLGEQAVSQLDADRQIARLTTQLTGTKGKYGEAMRRISALEAERDAAIGLSRPEGSLIIRPKEKSGTNEGTIIVEASDWHAEERVEPKRINGLNRFNLEIAEERITTFFQGIERLTRLLQQDIAITEMIVALLGDFISGDIHEEVAEACELPPMEAICWVQDRMIGGFDFLLNHTKVNLSVPCHVGNHSRTTKTSRFGSENGHSLEYLMYRHLAAYYRSEDRIRFDIADGPHSYATVYGKELRFQHGHMIKYNGGVGGLTIPANKAINEWNKGRKADLDLFGHFHTDFDGNNFLANGSLIGYNSFAMSIKAPFDVPKQTLILMDKKRGTRTCRWPILFKR